MQKYSITARNQLSILKWSLVFLICNIGVVIWIGFDMVVAMAMGFFVLIYYLIVFYFHYTYWQLNRDEEYLIDQTKIVRIKNGHEEEYTSEEIEKIIIYKSRNLSKGREIYAFELYYFASISLRSGEELVITCLVIPDLEEVIGRLKGVPLELKVRTPCSLKRK